MNSMTTERKEKLNAQLEKLYANESFTAEMDSCSTEKDYLSLLDKYGVHMTAEEIREAKEEAKAELQKMGYYRDDELSEEILASVAGGKNGRTRRIAGVLIGGLGVATANPFFFAAGCELFCWGCLR